jgi:co-chaperonin GroES (HSP10)
MISQKELDDLITHPPVKPTAFHLLVRTEEVEKVSTGGIVMMTEKEAGREKLGAALGYVVAIGDRAWKALEDGEPWAKLGDRVIFQRYDGMVLPIEGLDDGKWRLLKDEDVKAIWQS